MKLPGEMQERILEVLSEDNTIVFIMSHDGKYLSLMGGSNKALYSDGKILIGKSYSEVLKKEKAEYFQSMLDEVRETKAPLEREYKLCSCDFLEKLGNGPSEQQQFRANLYPLEEDSNDQVIKVVWVVHNITDNEQ